MAEVLRMQGRGARPVEKLWQRVLPSARLEPARPDTIHFEWASAKVDGLFAVSSSLSGEARSSADSADQLLACRIAAKDGRVGMQHWDLDATQPWLSSGVTTRAQWEGTAHVRALVFDRDRAQTFARRVSGDDRLVLRVTDPAPRTSAAGRMWESAFRHIMQGLGTAGDDDATLEAELGRHALMTTLSVFPTTYLDAVERPSQTRSAPASVRRAMGYMDEHARDPVTVDDVASAVRMSTRGLQYAFRRATGKTPTEYLRSARLSGAHTELLRGDAGTVAEVARRWGFSNPSRFAQHYRAAYGRNPSETAR